MTLPGPSSLPLTYYISRARQKYYAANNVGWCARPPHNTSEGGFIRKGHFKKASNMNYCLDFSIRVEDELLRLCAEFEQQHPEEEITVAKENELYSMAMETTIASDEGRTWAAGNVRLGEYILLVDCDTRVVSFLFVKNYQEFTLKSL
jgi:hypothetical protein